jgi:hypothetical protein
LLGAVAGGSHERDVVIRRERSLPDPRQAAQADAIGLMVPRRMAVPGSMTPREWCRVNPPEEALMLIEESAHTETLMLAWVAIGDTTIVWCEVIPSDVGYAVLVWLGHDDLVMAEMWPDLPSADERAEACRATLIAEGGWLLMT